MKDYSHLSENHQKHLTLIATEYPILLKDAEEKIEVFHALENVGLSLYEQGPNRENLVTLLKGYVASIQISRYNKWLNDGVEIVNAVVDFFDVPENKSIEPLFDSLRQAANKKLEVFKDNERFIFTMDVSCKIVLFMRMIKDDAVLMDFCRHWQLRRLSQKHYDPSV